MSSSLVAISASPSENSKTAKLVDHVLESRVGDISTCTHIRLRDLDATSLLRGRIQDDPKLEAALSAIEQADAIVIATPIFKAAYTGLLKSFLDILPQFGLAGKVVLPLATGGSIAHVLALDYALRPVLQSLGARHVVQSFFLCEMDVSVNDHGLVIAESARAYLDETVYHFMCSMNTPAQDTLLGHPRPNRASDLVFTV